MSISIDELIADIESGEVAVQPQVRGHVVQRLLKQQQRKRLNEGLAMVDKMDHESIDLRFDSLDMF